MKSRRGGEAEDTSEIICAGFGAEAPGNLFLDSCAADCPFSGIIGIGNAPVPRKSQDVILEVAEAIQQTPEFALGLGPRFPGARSGMGLAASLSSISLS